MVHRGFYEAAKGLYELLMPLIQAHVDSHGDKAKFYFTGHSLGGSLSTLLTLMLRHRGVLPVSALLPVYTFGSPSIMCGGDWLLEKLGFPLNHIRSVVMHYDIVPRSFACHYPDQIVEVLKRLNGTFRKHACLEQQVLHHFFACLFCKCCGLFSGRVLKCFLGFPQENCFNKYCG